MHNTMTDWTSFVLALVDSPLVVIVVGAGLSAGLAYFVTVRLYRPQKVFESKVRLYSDLVGALQEFRRDIPIVQHAMQNFPPLIQLPETNGLDPQVASDKVMDAISPRIVFNTAVLQAVSEMDPGAEVRVKVAELAGDLQSNHSLELTQHLYGALVAATSRASRTMSAVVRELGMFERVDVLSVLIDQLFKDVNSKVMTTISSGGKDKLDWSEFDNGIGRVQFLIKKDIGRAGKLVANAPGITLEDLRTPPDARSSKD